jgi:hypothetical protein
LDTVSSLACRCHQARAKLILSPGIAFADAGRSDAAPR